MLASQDFCPHLRFRLPQILCQQSMFLKNVWKVVILRSCPCVCDSWGGLCRNHSRSRDEELLVLCFQSCSTHPWSGQWSCLMINLQTAKKIMEIRPHLPVRMQPWCKWEWLTASPSPPFSMRLSAGFSLKKSFCDLRGYCSLCSVHLHVFSPRDTMGTEWLRESLQKFVRA